MDAAQLTLEAPEATAPPPAEALLSRATAGDAQAFSDWLAGEYDFIYRLAYRALGNRPDAEDLTHTVCERLPEKLRRYSRRGTARGWLARVVLNASLDFRRAARMPAPETPSEPPGQSSDRVYLRQVLAALSHLPPKSRDALLLVAEGLTHAEIADALDCSAGTVGWHVSTARAELVARLRRDEGGSE